MKLTPLTKISFFNIFINNLPARPGISNDYTHLTNFTNTSNPGINSLPKQTHMTTGNGECYTVIMHIRYQGNNHETMPVIQKSHNKNIHEHFRVPTKAIHLLISASVVLTRLSNN